ncbi:putative regulator PrlF [compost metagenome]
MHSSRLTGQGGVTRSRSGSVGGLGSWKRKALCVEGAWPCNDSDLLSYLPLQLPLIALSLMATATVNAKGQITIPVQVRATLGLRPGDEIEFVDLKNGQFDIVAATYPVERLKGMIRKP